MLLQVGQFDMSLRLSSQAWAVELVDLYAVKRGRGGILARFSSPVARAKRIGIGKGENFQRVFLRHLFVALLVVLPSQSSTRLSRWHFSTCARDPVRSVRVTPLMLQLRPRWFIGLL